MKWKAILSSIEGTSHIERKMPCQDYGDYEVIERIIIGAVADGAGSAKHSDLGAKYAVQTALSDLKKIFEGENINELQQPISKVKAKEYFYTVCQNAIDNLKNIAHEKSCDLKDLACTLLVFIATPFWITAMQIGDGFIVVHPENSDEYELLFTPAKGEYANETTFITSADALLEMKVGVFEYKPKFICASTDGLERLAIDFCNWKASAGFFKPFEEGLRTTVNLEQEKEDIKKWLNSKELNARTDDDKTILICLYESEIHKPNTNSDVASISENIQHESSEKETVAYKTNREYTITLWLYLSGSFSCSVLNGYLFTFLCTQDKSLKWVILLFNFVSIVWVFSITCILIFNRRFRRTIIKLNFLHLNVNNLDNIWHFFYKNRIVLFSASSIAIVGMLLGYILY